MFGFITDSIENAIDVADALFSGEDLNKRKVAKLISDGVSIAMIATALGTTVEVIERMLDD